MPNNLFNQSISREIKNTTFKTPPSKLPPIFHKIKSAYLLWYAYYQILPKTHRYTLGKKMDETFLAMLEAIAVAAFLTPQEKAPYIKFSIKKTDLLKIFIMLLWETKSLDDKKYIQLSEKLNEIGRNLGGWLGKIISKKENSPDKV